MRRGLALVVAITVAVTSFVAVPPMAADSPLLATSPKLEPPDGAPPPPEVPEPANAPARIAGLVEPEVADTSNSRELAQAIPAGTLFAPIAPVRVLDSRAASKVGPFATPWRVGSREVTVAGTGGVPADAEAVALNVTVTNTTASSHLRIWPKGLPMPLVSSLNWQAGWTIPNAVTVKVGTGGKINIYNNRGAVDVVVDVVGYYRAGADAGFTSLAPVRVLDSRATSKVGPYSTPWGVETRQVAVAGIGGVPIDADAVVLNVTATNTTSSSNLRIWPDGPTVPTVSSLNWQAGWTIPNAVTVKVGTGGKINIYNNQGVVDVVVDVVGYFRGGSGDPFHPVDPARILDSRPASNVGPYGTPWGVETRPVKVRDIESVPSNAAGVLLNVTATNTTASSNLRVWPNGPTVPLVSSLNWQAGWTIPNAVTAKVGTGGTINLYNNRGSADLVVDVAGWYGGPPRRDHCGTLTTSTTWSDDVVHHVTCEVVVPAGLTLTIAPGAIVKLGQLKVEGALVVGGDPARPTRLTALDDDSLGGDSNQNGPPDPTQRTQWAIQANGSVDVSHSLIRNGRLWSYWGRQAAGLSVRDSTFEGAGVPSPVVTFIEVFPAAGAPLVVQRNAFGGHRGVPIILETYGSPDLSGIIANTFSRDSLTTERSEDVQVRSDAIGTWTPSPGIYRIDQVDVTGTLTLTAGVTVVGNPDVRGTLRMELGSVVKLTSGLRVYGQLVTVRGTPAPTIAAEFDDAVPPLVETCRSRYANDPQIVCTDRPVWISGEGRVELRGAIVRNALVLGGSGRTGGLIVENSTLFRTQVGVTSTSGPLRIRNNLFSEHNRRLEAGDRNAMVIFSFDGTPDIGGNIYRRSPVSASIVNFRMHDEGDVRFDGLRLRGAWTLDPALYTTTAGTARVFVESGGVLTAGDGVIVSSDTARIKVQAGGRMQLNAGAVFKFRKRGFPLGVPEYAGIRVQGVLDIDGTPGNPVIFTSYRDDLFGDTEGEGPTTPATGDYEVAIGTGSADEVQTAGGQINASYAVFRYASTAAWFYRPFIGDGVSGSSAGEVQRSDFDFNSASVRVATAYQGLITGVPPCDYIFQVYARNNWYGAPNAQPYRIGLFDSLDLLNIRVPIGIESIVDFAANPGVSVGANVLPWAVETCTVPGNPPIVFTTLVTPVKSLPSAGTRNTTAPLP